MEAEVNVVKETLKDLKPLPLSGTLLDRLAGAMEQVGAEEKSEEETIIHATLNQELLALEERLKDFVPHGMPENMIGRLDEAMSRWHEIVPLEEKIVPMIPRETVAKKSYRPEWRSVAAVALLGVGAAFLISQDQGTPSSPSARVPVGNAGRTTPVVFIPGEASSSVVSASDHGVIWTKDGLPVRCLEVEVKNQVYFTNERGEKLILEQPKREVMFTPVELD